MKRQTKEQIEKTLWYSFDVALMRGMVRTNRHTGGDDFNYSPAEERDIKGINKNPVIVQTQIIDPLIVTIEDEKFYIDADDEWLQILVYAKDTDCYETYSIWGFKEFHNAGEMYTRLTADLLRHFAWKRES